MQPEPHLWSQTIPEKLHETSNHLPVVLLDTSISAAILLSRNVYGVSAGHLRAVMRMVAVVPLPQAHTEQEWGGEGNAWEVAVLHKNAWCRHLLSEMYLNFPSLHFDASSYHVCKSPCPCPSGITFKMGLFLSLTELLPCFRLSWQNWGPHGAVTNWGAGKAGFQLSPESTTLLHRNREGLALILSLLQHSSCLLLSPKTILKKKVWGKTNSKACLHCFWEVPRSLRRLLLQKTSKWRWCEDNEDQDTWWRRFLGCRKEGGSQEVLISISSFGCSAKTFVVCLLVLDLFFVQPLLYTVRSG